MAKTGAKPAWLKNQQKEINTVNSEQRLEQNNEKKVEQVTVRMLTDYRDVAKTGDLFTTDGEKANELVTLGRAEYVTK